jgi:hypothetical protein
LLNNKKKIRSRFSFLTFIFLGLLFLESDQFVLQSAIGRIRPNLILILLIGLYITLQTIFSRKETTLKMDKVGFYLILYVSVNIVSLFFADFANPLRIIYGLKVLFLLFCWFIVYFFIKNQFSNMGKGLQFLKYFFYFGFIQTLIGTSQMIGSFIRPTGTISNGDADYYGILISAYFTSMIILKILKVQVLGRRLDFYFLLLLSINLFYSFVRSGWIGTIGGLLFFVLIMFINAIFKTRTDSKLLGRFFLSLILIVFLFSTLFLSSTNLQDYAVSRIDLQDDSMAGITNNIRLIMMLESWENAKRSIIIGNGPSAFSLQGLLLDIPYRAENAFDPSIITTLLNDTGLIGLITFFIFIFKICSLSIKTFNVKSSNIMSNYSIAFTSTMIGLIVSYIPSTALWIPYSWVFFSIPSSAAYLASHKAQC